MGGGAFCVIADADVGGTGVAEVAALADDVTWGGGVCVGVDDPELHPKDKPVAVHKAQKAREDNIVGGTYHVCGRIEHEIIMRAKNTREAWIVVSGNMPPKIDALRKLAAAFPSSIRSDARFALQHVLEEGSVHDHSIGLVIMQGEALVIPSRIYFDPPGSAAMASLNPRQRAIVDCVFSRHHDGFLREKHLRALFYSSERFVPPFVIQLLGEYVIEIQQVLAENIDSLRKEPYLSFVAENPAFMELTRKRIISYWDCYHRRVTRHYRDFVGYKVWMVMCGTVP